MLSLLRKREWQAVGDDIWSTFAAAKQAAKEWVDKEEGGSQGRWQCDHKDHGKAGNRYILACNAHVDCPFRQLMQKGADGLFRRFVCGEHAAVLNKYSRKNAPVTQDQEQFMSDAINTGSKPGGMRTSMTLKEEARLRKAGKDFVQHKRKKGGLLSAS